MQTLSEQQASGTQTPSVPGVASARVSLARVDNETLARDEDSINVSATGLQCAGEAEENPQHPSEQQRAPDPQPPAVQAATPAAALTRQSTDEETLARRILGEDNTIADTETAGKLQSPLEQASVPQPPSVTTLAATTKVSPESMDEETLVRRLLGEDSINLSATAPTPARKRLIRNDLFSLGIPRTPHQPTEQSNRLKSGMEEAAVSPKQLLEKSESQGEENGREIRRKSSTNEGKEQVVAPAKKEEITESVEENDEEYEEKGGKKIVNIEKAAEKEGEGGEETTATEGEHEEVIVVSSDEEDAEAEDSKSSSDGSENEADSSESDGASANKYGSGSGSDRDSDSDSDSDSDNDAHKVTTDTARKPVRPALPPTTVRGAGTARRTDAKGKVVAIAPPSHAKRVAINPTPAKRISVHLSPHLVLCPASRKLNHAASPRRPPATPASCTPLRRGSHVQKQFKKVRDGLASALYAEANNRVFGGKLPANMQISWSVRLLSTAGTCVNTKKPSGRERTTRIELASKVVDCPQKLKETLLHEMCHAAVFLIDQVSGAPHGTNFKQWGRRVEKGFPDVRVTTCHNYAIDYKYHYYCTVCSRVYGRQSKSIRLSISRCKCGGMLRLEQTARSVRSAAAAANPNSFLAFCKRTMPEVRHCNPQLSMKEVMQKVSELWKQHQSQQSAQPEADCAPSV
eukprot:TRINITY_DN544_c0_g2_i3.p1 TRINITY_DN544_c0_g2~~TRINITY_DN544_c0_g2_i3.p1  ORF type:complete len:689 (-),score=131.23 TRINITY_DN544_c0_g2_i3:54-2120(-)